MGYALRDIAAALGAQVEGDIDFVIERASEPATSGPDDLAIAMDPRYAKGIAAGKAKVAVLWSGADWRAMGLKAAIFVPRARFAMAGLTRFLDTGHAVAPGIHPMAVVDPTAKISEGAAIGPFVSIAAGVVLGAGARVASHVSIAEGARIGAHALILQGAHIGARVVIGDRFICQPGAVIGSDGFSFVTVEKSRAEAIRETLGKSGEILDQAWVRIHSLGSVVIGDDVEIGANSCIDRGTIKDTLIGSGTKLDNLVHIAHNVQVGKDCLFCGMVGIAGSVQVGNRVVLGGQVGVSDNIFIGDDVVAGGGTMILTNAPAGRVLLGYPALKMDTHIDLQKAIRRLPRLAARVAAIEAVMAKSSDRD